MIVSQNALQYRLHHRRPLKSDNLLTQSGGGGTVLNCLKVQVYFGNLTLKHLVFFSQSKSKIRPIFPNCDQDHLFSGQTNMTENGAYYVLYSRSFYISQLAGTTSFSSQEMRCVELVQLSQLRSSQPTGIFRFTNSLLNFYLRTCPIFVFLNFHSAECIKNCT